MSLSSAPRVDLGAVLAHLREQKLSLQTPGALKKDLETWLEQQPAWFDALGNGVLGGLQGAALGLVMGSITKGSQGALGAASAQPSILAAPKIGPLIQARNFAVMTGVNSGVGKYAKRVRNVEDVYNSLAAAFASGAAFSLVGGGASGAPGTAGGGTAAAKKKNPITSAVAGGLMFAVFQGGFYKISELLGAKKGGAIGPAGPLDDYARVKGLLQHLGLSRYEKNFKKGLLEDRTIHLWDAASLTDAQVPPGPRLLILDHVNQYRDILSPAVPLPAPR